MAEENNVEIKFPKDEIFTEDEVKFFYDEFGLTMDQIEALSDEEYEKLWLAVGCIEGYEEYDEYGYPATKRAKIACSIVDKMYTD